MRIALFHNLPAGGAKRSTYEWVKRLSVNHEIDLFVYDDRNEFFLNLNSYIINKYVYSQKLSKNHIIALFQSMYYSLKISSHINNDTYDIALVMQCQVINSPFLLRFLKKPIIYYCQEPLSKLKEPHYRKSSFGLISFLKKIYINTLIFIDKLNANNVDVILTNSKYSIENIYRNYGIYPKLCYLGVDSNLFAHKNLKRENTILMVGSLNISKAQDFIIQSVGTMDIKPKVKFIFNFSYGASKFKSNLESLASKLGVDIEFANMVEDSDLIQEYNKSILTVFASRLEPLGLVPLESMSCGTPVIGVAEGGIRETIPEGICGLLVERDPILFGKAVARLINNTNLWNQLSINGPNYIKQNWNWEHSVLIIEKELTQLLLKENSRSFHS
jgi:glycosyltransferase involved in cell wall biosynthesis